MKKILVLSSAVLLSLSLYACGQAASSSQAASDAVASAASEAKSAASEVASAASEVASEAVGAASEAAQSAGAEASSAVADMLAESTFTLEELAKFNGKDGAKAYIAVDGVVYDVTDSKAWKDGAHNGYEAGKDLTEEMKKAPHGLSKLDNLTPVGVLAE